MVASMPNFLPKLKEVSIKLLPLIAFVVPLALLFLLNPSDPNLGLSGQDSFNSMWKGRTFQLFFVWLVALEFILSWEIIKPQVNRQNKVRAAAVSVAFLLPTLYVVLENYFGLNGAIVNWSLQNGVAFSGSMPLAVEYIVFAVLFSIIAFLFFGRKGLVGFALPALFVGLIGVLYTIDNVFPYGSFTPFQLLVPTTASLAAGVLGLMGKHSCAWNRHCLWDAASPCYRFIGDSGVYDCAAMCWHRELAYLYGCGFAVFEADEYFLESQNKFLRFWRGNHLLHKCAYE